nr:MAG TPA: hypothetical protein [Caudoviricetes sp.]
MSCKEKARLNVWLYCIILFVEAEIKQQESLTILPSPIISRKDGCLTSFFKVHPSLSPLGFIRCGCFEEHFAFLLSITIPILF